MVQYFYHRVGERMMERIKRFSKKHGFTLIELLAVLVIVGIILGIMIPSVARLLESQKRSKYSYHETIVEEAMDAYVDQYGDSFQEEQGECSCYKVPYQRLLDEQLIHEEDITCNLDQDSETKGFILAYPINGSRSNFRYEYYLTCRDQSTGEIIHETEDAPSGCCGVNSSFRITDYAVKFNDSNGSSYDYDWTNQNVYQEFHATDPYMAGIVGYEYSTDGGTRWTYVEGNHWTFTTDMDETVQVRAVDGDNNRSSVVSYNVKIDKTNPTCTVSGGNSSWTNQTVSITGTCHDSGSGCTGNAYRSFSGSGNVYNGYYSPGYVYDYAGNSTYCGTAQVKFDKDPPSCSVSGGNSSWTTGSVTVRGTCGGETGQSGCTGNVSQTTSSNGSRYVSPGTVYDNAGNSTSCGSTRVMIDNTYPSCNTTGGSSSWKTSVTLTGVCSNSYSDCTGNATRTFSGQNYNGSYSPGSVCNEVGHCTTCPSATVKIDISAPTVNNVSINCSSGTVTASASDNNGSPTIYYSVNGSSGNRFNPQCETTYTATVYAVDAAGNRSSSKTASCTTGPCCTPIAAGTACSASQLNQTNTCNGVTRRCVVHDTLYSYAWSPQGAPAAMQGQFSNGYMNIATCGSINGNFPKTITCGASNVGSIYTSGGSVCPGFSAWATASGATLTDNRVVNGTVSQHSFTCQRSVSGYTYWWQ